MTTSVKVKIRGRDINQHGISLITTLLFTVAVLVLGVSIMNINLIQERSIGNIRDRDLALQAAEAALRDAEQDVSINVKMDSLFSENCVAGLCSPPTQRSPLPATASLSVDKQPGFSWSSPSTTRLYGQYTGAIQLYGVSAQPAYVIEKLGNLGTPTGESAVIGIEANAPGTAYRISVRASGARSETIVFLQSIFAIR